MSITQHPGEAASIPAGAPTPIHWASAVSGNFDTAIDWTGGAVPGATDDAILDPSGASFTVTASGSETLSALELAANATLAITGGTFSVGLSATDTVANTLTIASGAAVTIADGATMAAGNLTGLINFAGSLDVAAGATLSFTNVGGTQAAFGNSEPASDGGQIDLLGAGAELVLVNAVTNNQTVQGFGTITGTNESVVLDNDGTIDANQSAAQLTVQNMAIFNAGTIEASNGASLLLSNVTTDGGLIQAIGAGSRVDIADGQFIDAQFISDTTLATSGGGVIEALGAANFYGVGFTIHNTGSFAAQGVLTLAGTIDNTGVMSLSGGLDLFQSTPSDGGQTVTLGGAGTVVLVGADNLVKSQSGVVITFDNQGNTISGSGQFGDGSVLNVRNSGTIDADGTGALVVNLAGSLTNSVRGVLEGGGAGGLSLAGGRFANFGQIVAMNGGSVTFGAGADLTNNVGGTLAKGRWSAIDTGGGAMLSISGPAISDDAAWITLSGAGSVFEAGGVDLEASLTTIAATGRLSLLAGRGWTSALSLTDNGVLTLGGGDFDAAGLTVNATGLASGSGDIVSPLTDDGAVEARGGTLTLAGAVTGTGVLKIAANSTLDIAGAAVQEALFGVGLRADLTLGDPSAFTGTLTNWGLRDTLDLAKTDVTSAQISGDTLVVDVAGGGVLDYNLSNPPTGLRIVLSSDGAGGTDLTLFKAKAGPPPPAPTVQSSAPLTQAMAAFQPPYEAATALVPPPMTAASALAIAH